MSQFIEDDSFHWFIDEDGESAIIDEDGRIIFESYDNDEGLEDEYGACHNR